MIARAGAGKSATGFRGVVFAEGDEIEPHTHHMLARILFLIGQADIDQATRAKREGELRALRRGYETQFAHRVSVTSRQRRELLKKIRTNLAERRKLRQQLGEGGREEIEQEVWWFIQMNFAIRGLGRQPIGYELFDALDGYEQLEEIAVTQLLDDRSGGRKPIRSLVIEPFFMMLKLSGAWETTSSKVNATLALFDWLEVPQKYRQTPENIANVVDQFDQEVVNGYFPPLEIFKRLDF